jgi:hypothetical protein
MSVKSIIYNVLALNISPVRPTLAWNLHKTQSEPRPLLREIGSNREKRELTRIFHLRYEEMIDAAFKSFANLFVVQTPQDVTLISGDSRDMG